jgi:hypothetical protein
VLQSASFTTTHFLPAEAARIKSHSGLPQDMIELCDLDRIYPAIGPTPSKHALRGLSVGIPVGEVCSAVIHAMLCSYCLVIFIKLPAFLVL